MSKNGKSFVPMGKRKCIQFDSDEELQKIDEPASLDWVDSMMKRSLGNAAVKAKQKRRIQEAQQQDPTVFQYDEIYDDMKEEIEVQRKKLKHCRKKPKYIDKILSQANRRKLDNERRTERQVQRERDAEGNEFADKEAFVSESFLKKMHELKQAEESERKERSLEALQDVTKHKNFTAFYSHLLDQTLGAEVITTKREPMDKKVSEQKKKHYRKRNDSTSSSASSEGTVACSSAAITEQDHKHKTSSYSNSNESTETHDNYIINAADKRLTSFKNISDIKDIARSSIIVSKVEEREVRIRAINTKRTTGQVLEKAIERFFNRKAVHDN